MKNTKNKILHKSFLTNQDLIQGIRNQSFSTQKNASSRVHTERSKITLIKKKSFERVQTQQQQNSYYAPNMGINEPIGTLFDKAVYLLQDCLTSLGQSNLKIQHKLKKVLSYVRDAAQQQKSTEQKLKTQRVNLEEIYTRRQQSQKQEKAKLKKMNNDLKERIMQYRQKILTLKKDVNVITKQKEPSGLQQVIINQSSIIDKQCSQYHEENNEIKRMMYIQARELQGFLKEKGKGDKFEDLRLYMSLQTQSVFKK